MFDFGYRLTGELSLNLKQNDNMLGHLCSVDVNATIAVTRCDYHR